MRTMEARKPFMIGVAGGTASGKSTVCDLLMEKLGQHEVNMDEKQVVHLSQDSFYRELTHAESEKAKKGMFNFDHPNAFDHELMELCLQQILAGRPTQVPVYDFKTNARVPGIVTTIYPSDVVLVEGILVFYYANMRNLFDLKLFVDTDADTGIGFTDCLELLPPFGSIHCLRKGDARCERNSSVCRRKK